MSRRFYVAPPALDAEKVELPAALATRLRKVLRLRPGDEITLFDGSGDDCRVQLDALTDRGATVTVIARTPGTPEPPVRVHLYQSITKGERFEWLLEKATEIGAARFTPLLAARAVVKTAAEGNRMERWRRIVVEAAEQCGRSAVPDVAAPLAFDAALESAPGVLLLPYEDAAALASTMTIEMAMAGVRSGDVSLLIGPEGGYERAEVERAVAAGALVITMGPRVLRSETAGLVALTLVLDAAGALR